MASEFRPSAQEEIVAPDAKFELVWDEGEFTEGPAASPIDAAIYFSDIGNRILRYDTGKGRTTVYREDSGKANGLMFDGRGRLYAAEGANGGNRRVTVTERNGEIRVLADHYDGKRLNSPNDLFVDSQMRVWFTDPRYVGNEPLELDFAGVFVVLPDGALRLATRELTRPNGILVSPDHQRLYVSDSDSVSGQPQLVSFPIAADGALGEKRVLFDFGKGRRGVDGMTLDTEGNIYAAAGKEELAGVYVFDREGKLLALIPTPGAPTNCEFGLQGEARTLYVTAALAPDAKQKGGSYGLYRIGLKKGGYRGHPMPVQ